MKHIFNPFLPSNEYIPDAEPHVFDGRVYIYGSHDLFNGKNFCLGDYVTYSCDVNDLTSWRYEGVIYRKDQDPLNKKNLAMYAPDCIKGVDGNYYLYYSVNSSGIIGIAKSSSPKGPFEFYSYVKYKNGEILGKRKGDCFQFDPAIFVEDENVYLYSGFCPSFITGMFVTGCKKISKEGPLCIKLDKDMCTIIEAPHSIGVKSIYNSKQTDYYGHEFFEASSMRKINNKYYFIYSSYLGHELCYAISNYPDRDFSYGGTIVSTGDIGINNINNKKDALNMIGNTHGSILTINEKNYIFYHRQTNRNCFSRQACAEEIKILPDGKIEQVEVTSCGLNNGPLIAKGEFEARIACNLQCKKGSKFYHVIKCHGRPYFTQNDIDGQYIENITDGTKITYKYFDFIDTKEIEINISSTNKGIIYIYDENNLISQINVNKCDHGKFKGKLNVSNGVHLLKFIYNGKGKISFYSFKFN